LQAMQEDADIRDERSKFYWSPKHKKNKHPPPDGWELIEPTIEELGMKMREGWWLCSARNLSFSDMVGF
jgi:hypothetical protein